MRAAAGDDDLPVPSPTYLLQNIYDELDGGAALHHSSCAMRKHLGLYQATGPRLHTCNLQTMGLCEPALRKCLQSRRYVYRRRLAVLLTC